MIILDIIGPSCLSDNRRVFLGGLMTNLLERLEKFEKMYEGVINGLNDVEKRMVKLKQQGKKGSATYKQLLVQKMTYKNMLEFYEIYDIKPFNHRD